MKLCKSKHSDAREILNLKIEEAKTRSIQNRPKIIELISLKQTKTNTNF